MNIARTTLSSKILTQHKEKFSKLAVDAVLRLKVRFATVKQLKYDGECNRFVFFLQGSGNLEAIQLIKKLGGGLQDSYLDEGFLLDKKVGVNQPKRIENAKILIANTPMDADKIKVL